MEYSRDVKWVGIGRLEYRLNSTKNIISDIKQGLGEHTIDEALEVTQKAMKALNEDLEYEIKKDLDKARKSKEED